MERRIAAILAADMVGYSRLIERDEVGTLDRQKRHLKDLIGPAIAAKNGSIVKLTGDGLIAEFSSVVEAVQCAVSVQAEMALREKNRPDDEKITYRVAIHLGDVVFDGGDVYGDGVNVAARLEGLADPGGVVVSGTAYDHLKANVAVGYEDLGEQQVKNIATPVRVYRVVPEGTPTLPQPRRSFRRLTLLAALATCVVLGTVALVQFALRDPDRSTAVDLPGLTIAVLPFQQIGDLGDLGWLPEGLALEISVELSRVPNLNVISRSATIAAIAENPDAAALTTRLGADYLLEGDASVTPDRMRISVRLSDTNTGRITWEERYNVERKPTDLFQVQNEIARKVAIALGDDHVGTLYAEAARQSDAAIPADFESQACFVQSLSDWAQTERQAQWYACASEAVARDPNYARGWAAVAGVLTNDFVFRTGVVDMQRAEKKRLALDYAEKARKLDANDPFVRVATVAVFRYLMPRDRFWAEMDLLLDSGYWLNTRMGWLGMSLAHTGKWEEGIAIVEKAMALSPKAYPSGWHWAKADWLYLNGEYEAALEEYHKAATPGSIATPIHYAHIYAAVGDVEKAREWADKLQDHIPGFTIEIAISMFEGLNFDPAFIPLVRRDLEIAGVPGGKS